MCRLMAIPEGFNRDEAIEILKGMEGLNVDGFGYCYVHKGNFVVKKWRASFSWLLNHKYPILNHLKNCKGYTIVHQRKASFGEKTKENAHPFILNNLAMIHNGSWNDSKYVKLALGKTVKLTSETDSELALHCIQNSGIQKFVETVDCGGVYLILRRDGIMFALRTGYMGDLEIHKQANGKMLLASEFPKFPIDKYKSVEAKQGWYKFSPNGTCIASKEKIESWRKNLQTTYYPGACASYD